MSPKEFLFPALVVLSLAMHGWVLAGYRGTAELALPKGETVVTVTLEVPPPEPLPPEPEDVLPPEPPQKAPQPDELPLPEEPEVLTSDEEEAPPAPMPPPATPVPTPVATPKPTPKPVPKKSTPKPVTRAAPAPTAKKGAVVAARPDSPRNRPPSYPEHARRQGWEGSVVVRASVGADGKVRSVSVARSSGYGVLDQAALRAVRGWKFRPQTVGGTPSSSTVEVPVNFSLRR